MFLNELTGVGEAVWSCQQKSQPVSRIQFVEELVEDPGLAVVMYVNIDKFWGMRLRHGR